MALLFANNASGTLANTLTVGSTTAVLTASEGALFPLPTGGDTFYATVEDASGAYEIVSVTARSTDTFTIVRAQEGTAEQEFAAGSRFEMRVTAAVLDALVQAVTAAATYAPLTHFDVNGVTARLLNNGAVTAYTGTQGLNVRRTTGQTTTYLILQNDAGTIEGEVYTTSVGSMAVFNNAISGALYLQGRNSAGTTANFLIGSPDSSVTQYYAGNRKTATAQHGIQVFGTNVLAPFSTYIDLFNSSGSTEIGRIGFVGSTNELRITSLVDGFPIAIVGDDSAGTARYCILVSPNGAATLYYAGSNKLSTTSTGVAITGKATQTSAPTAASDLTTKTYVDTTVSTAVAAVTSPGSSLGSSGYYRHAGGYTEQWGVSTTSASTGIGVSFPLTFSSVYNVQLTENALAGATLEHRHAVTSLTTSGFTIAKPGDYSMGYYWLARGIV